MRALLESDHRLNYLKAQQMSNAMTVIHEKVETKLKYVSTARKRQRGRGTKYTSDGSDWSTGRINGS